MDKGLQEVINKLKASQVSQTSKPIDKPVEKPVKAQEQVEEDEDADDPDFYEEDKPVEKPIEKPAEDEETMKKAELQMELLNNNGRFRAEMLFQLQEINKALVVIAQVLMQNK